MRVIYHCKNYMYESLYVDTSKKQLATDANKYEQEFCGSDAEKFIYAFDLKEVPIITITNKRDYYKLKSLYVNDGFKELK